MPSQFTINQILQFQEISQYLAANDKSSLMQLQSGSYIGILPQLLYMEGSLLQNMNSLNSGNPALRGTAEYVLSLCGKYLSQAIATVNNLLGAKPVITGPTPQSVTVGNTATFTVSVASSTPAIVQWYLNGVIIPGALGLTYSVTNAQLSMSGNLYSVMATNLSGSVQSNQVVLTVTANILLYAFYTSTDPSGNINSQIDNFGYQFTVVVVHNQPISIPIPQAQSNNMFWVFRVVNTEQVDNTWFNTALNSGTIPDSVFYSAASFAGNTYYYLRNATSFDFTQPLILSKV